LKKTLKYLIVLSFLSGFAKAEFRVKLVDDGMKPVVNAVLTAQQIPGSIASADAMEAAIMDQIDRQFVPRVLVVNKNQPVLFPNSDQVRHHVYSFSRPNDFEIKLYSGVNDTPMRFEHSGIVVLGCNIHDQMLGYIYVSDAGQSVKTDSDGIAVFEGEPPSEIRVWHSRLSATGTAETTKELAVHDSEGNWLISLELTPVAEKKSSSNSFRSRFK